MFPPLHRFFKEIWSKPIQLFVVFLICQPPRPLPVHSAPWEALRPSFRELWRSHRLLCAHARITDRHRALARPMLIQDRSFSPPSPNSTLRTQTASTTLCSRRKAFNGPCTRAFSLRSLNRRRLEELPPELLNEIIQHLDVLSGVRCVPLGEAERPLWC